jgi:hypothetical protein
MRGTPVHLLTAVADVLAAGPDPGGPVAPPGSQGFLTIIRWVMWVALGVCVLGVVVTGASMAIASRRGEGGEHASRLLWVLGGTIIIGSATGLVSALT